MARKNVTTVFSAFLEGRATNRNATISTDGETIYSYTTEIAWGVYDDAGRLSGLEMNPRGYSVTTTQQQNSIRELARLAGLIVTDRA